MIVYYSGTGNSRIVAEKIASLTSDEIICANPNIKNSSYKTINSDKPWVFVSPTYAWKIPNIFKEFITRTRFEGNNKAYFFMTCGSEIGAAGEYLKMLCKEKSFNYMGVKAVLMPENYTAMFSVPDEDETRKIIEDAMAEIEKISKVLIKGEELQPVKVTIFGRLASSIVNRFFTRFCTESSKFSVSEDKCIGCGLCEKNCPVNCVRIVEGKPIWTDKCCHCMACINGCPKIAIEYGKISLGKPRIYNGEARKNESNGKEQTCGNRRKKTGIQC